MSAQGIYVIDDDTVYLNLCRHLLGKMGYSPGCSGSVESIDWSMLDSSSILLLDLLMPGQDGFDLLDLLEARGYRGKILLMTGVDLAGAHLALERLLSCNLLIVGMLHKPFFAAQLQRAVQQALTGDELLLLRTASKTALELAIQSRQFDVQLLPVLNATTGEVQSLSASVSLCVDGHYFPQASLEDLLLYTGLYCAYFDALLHFMMTSRPEYLQAVHRPLELHVPARLLLAGESNRALCSLLVSHVEKGLVVKLVVSESSVLLHGDALLQGLSSLIVPGLSLVLEDADVLLSLEAMPALTLFDELRLASSRANLVQRHADAVLDDGKLLAMLHRGGFVITVRKDDVLTRFPGDRFKLSVLHGAPGLQPEMSWLRAAGKSSQMSSRQD
jgi:FixJ family two-component response regulator